MRSVSKLKVCCVISKIAFLPWDLQMCASCCWLGLNWVLKLVMESEDLDVSWDILGYLLPCQGSKVFCGKL